MVVWGILVWWLIWVMVRCCLCFWNVWIIVRLWVSEVMKLGLLVKVSMCLVGERMVGGVRVVGCFGSLFMDVWVWVMERFVDYWIFV